MNYKARYSMKMIIIKWSDEMDIAPTIPSNVADYIYNQMASRVFELRAKFLVETDHDRRWTLNSQINAIIEEVAYGAAKMMKGN